MERESPRKGLVEANSTGGQGSQRAVEPDVEFSYGFIGLITEVGFYRIVFLKCVGGDQDCKMLS
jgi:hypothetical protein